MSKLLFPLQWHSVTIYIAKNENIYIYIAAWNGPNFELFTDNHAGILGMHLKKIGVSKTFWNCFFKKFSIPTKAAFFD